MSGVESADEFDAAFQIAYESALAQRRATRRSAVEGIGSQVVARLALAPVWTEEVLDASGLADPGTLDRLVDVGVADRIGDCFVLAEDRVDDAIGPVLRSGPEAVTEQLRIVADGVSRARARREVDIPAPLDRFTALTEGAHSAEEVADQLITKVTEAPDIADAVNWIDAAARLETALGREIVAARLRAGRVVAGRRRDTDLARFLRGYFPRPALEARLLALRDGSAADPWSVHLRAPAGRGKTMLVRWLDARFPSDGSAGSIVRVDFDYLRPSYPGTEPGLLLTLLAAQLRQFAPAEALIRFDRFDDLVADWHARIDEAERTRSAEVPGIREGRRNLIFDSFANAVRRLPVPVMVILDTTEELEKAGGGDANVRSTIAMLVTLHDRVPALRVVLSGRRGLPLPDGAEELPVPGFDRDEAARFVAWIGVDDARARAIVERVAADGTTGGVNPFDLGRLARWARDDPDLDTEAIHTADDEQYIEQRIIGRLWAPELRDALPVVVALGRFDVPTLGAVTGIAGDALDRLAASATSQEWITTETGGVLALDPQLAARLAAYLQRHRRVAWDSARSRAGAQLRSHCLQAQRTAVTVEHVAGAIRLTDAEADREGAEDWWARFEDRARADADYGWLLNITGRLRAADGAVPPEHPLHGAVTASQAACLDREDPDLPAGHVELWRLAHEHAEPESRLAARTAAHLPDGIPAALARWAEPDEALAASFVTGAESWAALDPATAEALWKAAVARGMSPELTAMAAVLVGRAHGRAGHRAACRQWLDRAVGLVEVSVGRQSGNEWIDWPVDDVAARVRLWAARIWWPELGSATEAAELLGVRAAVENADQERAAALAGMLELARGGPRRPAAPAPPTPFPPRSALHLDVPPPAVPRALALARAGDVDSAVALLEDMTSVHQSGPDYLATERALMLLVRRFRLRDVGIGLTSGLVDSSEVADRSLLADLVAHDGDQVSVPPWGAQASAVPPGPDILHLWWRAVRAGDAAGLAAARGWPFAGRFDADGSAAEMHRVWDAWELARMTAMPPPPLPDVTAWARTRPREPEACLRLHLRAATLTGTDVENERVTALVARLGRNLAAEVALDEGESLALRLPRNAHGVLVRAARWFTRAGDFAGALRASASAALAVLVDGGPAAVSATLDDVAAPYRVLGGEAGLPRWEELRERPDAALAETPRCWQPWVARVAVLLVAASGSRHDTLFAEVRRRFGSSGADNRIELPTELATALSAARESQYLLSFPAAPATRPRSRGLPPPATLQIEGVTAGTHIVRGNPARIVVRSAEGEVLGDAVLEYTDPLRPYAQWLLDDSALTPLLAALPRPAPLELHHPADLGALPWEAIVAAALARGVPEPAAPTMWRRLQRAGRRRPRRSTEWHVLEVSRDPVPITWSHRVTHAADLEKLRRPVPDARVVHLVGWASETRSGVGFATDRPDDRKTAQAPRTASELTRSLPRAELVIVQGLPDGERVLGDWSREQAAYLRQIGADLALAGLAAVIVIPPGAVRAPEGVVDAVAADASEQLSPTRLLSAVEALRTQLRTLSPPERATEDALGVCLFLSDTLLDPDS